MCHEALLLLPCREFSGQGFYSWAKAGLHRRIRQASHSSGSTAVQVESLAGHVTRLEVVRSLPCCGRESCTMETLSAFL